MIDRKSSDSGKETALGKTARQRPLIMMPIFFKGHIKLSNPIGTKSESRVTR
jgi:hypothetical protein